MPRYIDADKALSAIDENVEMPVFVWNDIFNTIQSVPAADVEEVVHSKWTEDENGNCFCENCSHPILHNYHEDRVYAPRCWFCGAKMDGGGE